MPIAVDGQFTFELIQAYSSKRGLLVPQRTVSSLEGRL
jgi:hypothetical protein